MHVHVNLRPHPLPSVIIPMWWRWALGAWRGSRRPRGSPPKGAQLSLHKMLWDRGRLVVSDGKSTELRPQMSSGCGAVCPVPLLSRGGIWVSPWEAGHRTGQGLAVHALGRQGPA